MRALLAFCFSPLAFCLWYFTVLELGFGEEVEDKAGRGAVAEMMKVFAEVSSFAHRYSIWYLVLDIKRGIMYRFVTYTY